MNPIIWGPGAWTFLHSITLNYPENPTDKEKMFHKNFFLNLQNVLPCPSCAQHYSMNLKKFPIDPALESRELLVKWLIDIHNEVFKKEENPLKLFPFKLPGHYTIEGYRKIAESIFNNI